jgi:hypothetical protein
MFDQILTQIPQQACEHNALYIPNNASYAAIDALFLRISKKESPFLVEVFPIQVTIAKDNKHSDSVTSFYNHWNKWTSLYDGCVFSTTFLWIMENDRAVAQGTEKVREMRSGPSTIKPKHKVAYVPIAEVCFEVSDALRRYRENHKSYEDDVANLRNTPDAQSSANPPPMLSEELSKELSKEEPSQEEPSQEELSSESLYHKT